MATTEDLLDPEYEDVSGSPGGRGQVVMLVAVLLLLLGALGGLLYVYQFVGGSPEPVEEAQIAGLDHQWSAYTLETDSAASLNRPIDVAWDGADRIYVSDPLNHRVVVFDADGRSGRVFAAGEEEGSQAGLKDYTLINPLGIDVGDDGRVYVADPQKAGIIVFSPDGEKLQEIRSMAPKYVAVEGDRVYVIGTGTLRVYDTDGNEVGSYGSYGRSPDQLSYPGGIAVGGDGTIYIADTNNYRITALSPDLEMLWQYGAAASTREEQDARDLASPAGITVGSDGNLYVVDGLNSYIRVFDTAGESVSVPLGEPGDLENQFYYPDGIVALDDGLFVVADRFKDRIVAVRLSAMTEAQAVADLAEGDQTDAAALMEAVWPWCLIPLLLIAVLVLAWAVARSRRGSGDIADERSLEDDE